MKKWGNSRGGEALGVAKPVSPPHTPPLRARRCATPWRVLIYRLSPVCCCIGSVRLSRFFVPPDGKAARAAGLFPGIWQIGGALFSGIGRLGTGLLCRPLSVHHTPIGTIPTQPTPKNAEFFSIHCNIPQRRTVTCPERGSARGKSGLRNSERLSPSQTCPLLKCPPERETSSAQERTSDARHCTISGTIFSFILSILHSLVYYKEHTSNLLTLKSESVILWSS